MKADQIKGLKQTLLSELIFTQLSYPFSFFKFKGTKLYKNFSIALIKASLPLWVIVKTRLLFEALKKNEPSPSTYPSNQ